MYVDFCHFCCFVTELKKYLICLEISPLPYLWLTKVFSVIIRMLFISDFFTLMNIMYMCVCAFVLQAYVCMWCVCLCVHVCVCVCVYVCVCVCVSVCSCTGGNTLRSYVSTYLLLPVLLVVSSRNFQEQCLLEATRCPILSFVSLIRVSRDLSRGTVVLSQDQDSSTYTVNYKHLITLVPEISSDFHRYQADTWYTYIHRNKILIHI